MRVALIGCGKQKAPHACAAREMYRSELFRKSLAYAQATCDRAFVLSAKHGLLDLDQVIEPYDLRLADLGTDELSAWGRRVGEQLDAAVPELDAEIVVLASEGYSRAIELPMRDFYWEEPLRGLGIGKRLSWLKTQAALGGRHA